MIFVSLSNEPEILGFSDAIAPTIICFCSQNYHGNSHRQPAPYIHR